VINPIVTPEASTSEIAGTFNEYERQAVDVLVAIGVAQLLGLNSPTSGRHRENSANARSGMPPSVQPSMSPTDPIKAPDGQCMSVGRCHTSGEDLLGATSTSGRLAAHPSTPGQVECPSRVRLRFGRADLWVRQSPPWSPSCS